MTIQHDKCWESVGQHAGPSAISKHPQVLLPCPGQIQTVENMADGGQQVPDSLLLSREQNLGGPIDDTVPGSAGPVRGQDLCRPPQGAGPNFMRLKMKADR